MGLCMHRQQPQVYQFTCWSQYSMARLDYNGGKFPTLPGSYNSPVYRPCTGGQTTQQRLY